MKITIRTIPHSEQRYPTWADWEIAANGNATISISEVGDWRKELATALHEQIEMALCRHHGISQETVDAFDVDYENRRMKGVVHAACGCEITDDPGMDVHAPYHAEHVYATGVEYGFARLLGLDAKEYDAAFIALDGGVAGNRK